MVAADRIDFAADGIDFANDLIEFWQAALYVRPTSWARCSRMWGGSLHRSRGRGTLRGSGGVSSSAVS